MIVNFPEINTQHFCMPFCATLTRVRFLEHIKTALNKLRLRNYQYYFMERTPTHNTDFLYIFTCCFLKVPSSSVYFPFTH